MKFVFEKANSRLTGVSIAGGRALTPDIGPDRSDVHRVAAAHLLSAGGLDESDPHRSRLLRPVPSGVSALAVTIGRPSTRFVARAEPLHDGVIGASFPLFAPLTAGLVVVDQDDVKELAAAKLDMPTVVASGRGHVRLRRTGG
jgi:hypothetical protein